jgi:hypothetical protein
VTGRGTAGGLAWRAAGAIAAVCIFARCNRGATEPPNIPPNQVFKSLAVSPQATTLAVGGTQQLTVTPLNLTGAPLPGGSAAVFASSDSTHISISPTGVITALQPTVGGPMFFTVTLQLNGVTHADTGYVSVTPTPQAAASLTIEPPALVPANLVVTVPAVVLDSNGNVLSGIYPYFWVSQNSGASIAASQGTLSSATIGTAWVHASVTAYGVPLQDSVQITFTYPASGYVEFTNNGAAITATNGVPVVDSLWISAGGGVLFVDISTDTTMSVIFDDSTAVVGANIHGLGLNSGVGPIVRLLFPAAGTYNWHVSGVSPPVTGVVVVQ